MSDHPEKNERPARGSLLPMIPACIICVLLGVLGTLCALRLVLGEEIIPIIQSYTLIHTRFVGEYDETEWEDAVLEGMVDSLGDRWSYYLTPAEYTRTMDTRRNAYVGIGVSVGRNLVEDGLVILSVNPEGPAAEAGLQPGEIIRAVDGEPVTTENQSDSVERMKGEEGTSVTLLVEDMEGGQREVEVIRAAIVEKSVRWEMLEGDVGLITIRNFYSGTADLVKEGGEELIGSGARGLIFDVRNNPGGYISELTAILDYLLPEGTTFIQREYSGTEKIYSSDAGCVAVPLAVLVNGESYSASEFLAAQLRETAGSGVAGTPTCGKGFSQNLFKLWNGGAVGLSTARYFTAAGESLIGVGLTPDAVVEISDDEAFLLRAGILPPEADAQLQAAVGLLGLED